MIWQAPKSTRKRNTPENADNRPFPESAFSGVLRFRVCFGALLEGNKEHPKTQHTQKRRFWKRSVTCVFGCVAFSGAFWRLPNDPNPIFMTRQADSPESLEFPIRANRVTRANHANFRFARITPLSVYVC